MSTCPKPTPPPCPTPVCPPPPQKPPCRVKPVMRGLHWAQTTAILKQAIGLSILSGTLVYLLIGRPRRKKYEEFYAKAEFAVWADEMARKGLFQSVPTSPSS